mmetsp:Transcript_1780/g.3967  ORF Transcript_1780/g.3967 Transcript_1780/m.3967 type:complete len:831 (-) Transcript_1780:77-2569(-)|eukprot:CAMPEP_0113610904 /NCGR_PEP_ID=MMETSP0017_2-20120614/5274_1 /TAXON_ID=2856 /ORGANISM="Cylindrotheca closterium" /LENGTH=830 /DNA_ID=CAMNT_0000519821 /DNA_START=518 /DNA_END=3010 /DNA_ORIENTATION=- /assembly_acc=CAM_ASM_000147
MPIFRIMGGSRNSNAASHMTQQTGNNNAVRQADRRSVSRHQYPGQRLQQQQQQQPQQNATYTSPNEANQPNRMAGPNPAAAQNNPLVRGNNVPSSTPNPPGTSDAQLMLSMQASEVTRAGAYSVTRTSSGPAQVYRVTVPPGVRPGSEFTVHAGARRVRVRCPPNSRPGHSLQITLPPEPVTHNQLLKVAPLTCAEEDDAGGGAVKMTPEVQKVNQAATESGGVAQTFLVTIPPNIYPGMQFTVNVEGQRFMVTCPANAGPNMKVRIVPPTQREEPMAAPKTQVFEVTVPAGVRPNQPFTLMANGQRVLVTCPTNVAPGQKIRFQLPVQQVIGNIQLSYENESGGWCRTIRVKDLKFQWVRVQSKKEEQEGFLDDMEKFDFSKAAYVRKLSYLEGNDARMRTAKVDFVPANEAVVDSRLLHANKTLLSYADIANIQGKGLEDKIAWFQNITKQLMTTWENGHVKLVVRRHSLLQDSVDAVMSLGRDDMRKHWRIEFLGEPAIDAGGVTREWFQLVSEQLFDPDFGLWLSSVNNQMCMTINPASDISCPDDHLIYFRFLGRIMGRALFDRQLIKGHMVRHFYKHLLGWPITFEDLEAQDEEYYTSLKKFTTMEDLSMMCLDFTITEETMGVRRDVELIEGGNMKEVTAENLPQYLESNLRYRMLDRVKPQIRELMLGFFDIIPEPALTVFDPNELELTLCGLPTIEMDDWEGNTIYSGLYETSNKGKQRHKCVQWFWEVVRDDFDQEMKARLLQFVTGTSGVPTRGFSVLQGNDGNIKKFAIHGVNRAMYAFPRSHTCFNRIDLPNYSTKKELYEKLKAAITMSSVGFDME